MTTHLADIQSSGARDIVHGVAASAAASFPIWNTFLDLFNGVSAAVVSTLGIISLILMIRQRLLEIKTTQMDIADRNKPRH